MSGTEGLVEDRPRHKAGAEVSEERLCLADRLALRPAEAARALGISERRLRQLLPKLPAVREEGVVMIPVDSLREWLREQARADEGRVEAVVKKTLGKFDFDK